MEEFQMTTKVWHKSTKMIIKALFINQSINQSTVKNQQSPFSSLTQISLAKLSLFGFVEKASFEAVVVAAAVAAVAVA